MASRVVKPQAAREKKGKGKELQIESEEWGESAGWAASGSSTRLLAVEDDSSVEGELVHPVEHIGQARERLDREGRLDLAGSSDREGLDGVLSVTDVRSDDALGPDDGPEDVGLDLGVGRETDSDDGAVRSEVLEG